MFSNFADRLHWLIASIYATAGTSNESTPNVDAQRHVGRVDQHWFPVGDGHQPNRGVSNK